MVGFKNNPGSILIPSIIISYKYLPYSIHTHMGSYHVTQRQISIFMDEGLGRVDLVGLVSAE